MTTVEQAAASLMEAFGRGDKDAYFACFAPSASMVFHNVPERLHGPEQWRALWETWERTDGFRVVGAESRDGEVTELAPGLALFVHDVVTHCVTDDGAETLHERESIVFSRDGERWLVVHEHLSPRPTA